jgi:hypothetical protein
MHGLMHFDEYPQIPEQHSAVDVSAFEHAWPSALQQSESRGLQLALQTKSVLHTAALLQHAATWPEQ